MTHISPSSGHVFAPSSDDLLMLKQSHARQMSALEKGTEAQSADNQLALAIAVDEFCDATAIDQDGRSNILTSLAAGSPLLQIIWAETGNYPLSLFAYLPGCLHCLTQAKAVIGKGADCEPLALKLKLDTNPLIPTKPAQIGLEQLSEFSRLQILAKEIALPTAAI